MKNDTLNRDRIVSFLRSQKPYLLEQFGVTKIALFGSFAREEQGPESDIDLLISMNDVSYRKLVALKRHLEEHFNVKVDIGYFNSIRTHVRKMIQEDLVYA